MWSWMVGIWFRPIATTREAARAENQVPVAEIGTFVVVFRSLILAVLLFRTQGWYAGLLAAILSVLEAAFVVLVHVALIATAARRLGWLVGLEGAFVPYAVSLATWVPMLLLDAALLWVGVPRRYVWALDGLHALWNWWILLTAIRFFSGFDTRRSVLCVLPVVVMDILLLAVTLLVPAT